MKVLLLCLLLAVPALVFAQEDLQKKYEAIAADRAAGDAGRLHRLFALDWERIMQNYPEFATSIGYKGLEDRWTDESWQAIQARKAQLPWPLAAIKSIDRAKLSKAEQVSYDLFRRDLELGIEENRFPDELLAISQMGGVQQNVAQVIEEMPRASLKNYEHILARLRAAPRLIEQNIDLLRRGLAQGITQPKITLREVPQQILNVIPEDPLRSALLLPFTEFPAAIPAAEQERLRAAAITIYKDQLVPAYRKLYEFVSKEYLPGARESIGLSALPDGEAWYALRVRESTTTSLTPKEIHELGLSEIRRIRAEMEKVIAEAKFQGNFEEFAEFLRTDPQFYYKYPSQLLAGYRDIGKRIEPELPRLFGKLPRLPYGIRPVPSYGEKSAAAAYYQSGSEKVGRAGNFFANTFNLPGRPKWEMESLTLHEAVPGHHLQIALAQEMEGVPEFRKYNGYTAYVEGWGLYAESLGGELGLYKDPYSKFGALTFEMWRACRLVVDTGIHAFGWSRQQAIDFMMKNSGKEEHDSTVEVDRYIVWPAQALAYKVGQLKIRALRDYAEKELGESFDIRGFHDTVLANGALPLDTLEVLVQEWVTEQKMKNRMP